MFIQLCRSACFLGKSGCCDRFSSLSRGGVGGGTLILSVFTKRLIANRYRKGPWIKQEREGRKDTFSHSIDPAGQEFSADHNRHRCAALCYLLPLTTPKFPPPTPQSEHKHGGFFLTTHISVTKTYYCQFKTLLIILQHFLFGAYLGSLLWATPSRNHICPPMGSHTAPRSNVISEPLQRGETRGNKNGRGVYLL